MIKCRHHKPQSGSRQAPTLDAGVVPAMCMHGSVIPAASCTLMHGAGALNAPSASKDPDSFLVNESFVVPALVRFGGRPEVDRNNHLQTPHPTEDGQAAGDCLCQTSQCVISSYKSATFLQIQQRNDTRQWVAQALLRPDSVLRAKLGVLQNTLCKQ